jgi:hypothetical protein
VGVPQPKHTARVKPRETVRDCAKPRETVCDCAKPRETVCDCVNCTASQAADLRFVGAHGNDWVLAAAAAERAGARERVRRLEPGDKRALLAR